MKYWYYSGDYIENKISGKNALMEETTAGDWPPELRRGLGERIISQFEELRYFQVTQQVTFRTAHDCIRN